jgi:AGZA family xanthine/uracil permease-like MFS transporter
MEQITAPKSSVSLIERVFGLAKAGTNPRTEIIAGLTTFLTMVYIVFVNPQILGNTGMDKGAVFVATCIAAAVSTLVMALYANYPIALAPGMGLNAFCGRRSVIQNEKSSLWVHRRSPRSDPCGFR